MGSEMCIRDRRGTHCFSATKMHKSHTFSPNLPTRNPRGSHGSFSSGYSHQSCTHTTDLINFAWWKVDLLDVVELSRVRVYNRMEYEMRLTGISIATSINGDAYTNCTYWGDDAIPYKVNNSTVKMVEIQSCRGRLTRWVKIEKHLLTGAMTLCEVEVYAG